MKEHINYKKEKKKILSIIIVLLGLIAIMLVFTVVFKTKILYSPQLSPSYCSDSDGGINYLVSGTTEREGAILQDFCVDDKRLIEHYCDSEDNIKLEQHICVNSCSRGKCSE